MARSKNRGLSYESLSLNGYPADQVKTVTFGNPGTLSFRVFFQRNGSEQDVLSPWHEILLFAPNGNLTCICNNAAGSWLIHEPAMDEPFNPLRPVKSEFGARAMPAHYDDNSLWNVSILPQTWVTVGQKPRPHFQPMEVIDIAARRERQPGDVYIVKPLGACCMEEDGLIIWKIIGVASDDSMASVLNDIDDVETWLPGLLDLVQAWLKDIACAKSGLPADEQLCTLVDLVLTRQKLFELHDSWRLNPARTAMQMANAQLSLPSLNSEEFKAAWKPYLEKFKQTNNHDTLLEEVCVCVPVSCPTSQSEVLFDPSWFSEPGMGHSGFESKIVEETSEAMEEANREAGEESHMASKEPELSSLAAVQQVLDTLGEVGEEATKENHQKGKTKFGSLTRKAKSGLLRLLHIVGSSESDSNSDRSRSTSSHSSGSEDENKHFFADQKATRFRSEELKGPPKVQALFSQSSLDSIGSKRERKRRSLERKQWHSGEILGGFGAAVGVPSRMKSTSVNMTKVEQKPYAKLGSKKDATWEKRSATDVRSNEDDEFSKRMGKGSSSSETSEISSSTTNSSESLHQTLKKSQKFVSAKYRFSSSANAAVGIGHSKFEDRKLTKSLTCKEAAGQESSISKTLISYD